MTDIVSVERRSEIMASVHHKDTGPEKIVRSFLHGKGVRYRLHVKDLPGKPDLVSAKYGATIFINGCFWHGHEDEKCKLARIPKSNTEFWETKINKNRARDQRNWQELQSLGWKVIVVWECQLRENGFLEQLARDLTCL